MIVGLRPRRRDAAVVVVLGLGAWVAVGSDGGMIGVELSETSGAPPWPVAAMLVVGVLAPLLWRRRYPVPVLAGSAVGFVALQLTGMSPTPADLALSVAAASAARRADSLGRVLGVAGVVTALVLALPLLRGLGVGQPVDDLVVMSAVLFAPLAAGAWARRLDRREPDDTAELAHGDSDRLPPGLDSGQAADVGLTPREATIRHLVCEGLSNDEIAERLTIGRETVKSHVASVLRKHGVRDRIQLIVAVRDSHTGDVAEPLRPVPRELGVGLNRCSR